MSDLLSSEAQELLFDYERSQEERALAEIEAEHRAGGKAVHYTGERWMKANPDKGALALRLLGRGESVRAVSEFLGVHDRILARVAETYASELEALKKQTGMRLRHVTRLSVDELLDRLTDPAKREKISAKDLAIIIGIASDQAREHEGGPSQRIEISVRSGKDVDVDAYLAGIREVEDAASRVMSSRAGESAPIGGAPAALPAPQDPAADPAAPLFDAIAYLESLPVARDTQSDMVSDGCCTESTENMEEPLQ